MKESPNLRVIWFALANVCTLFRINSGQAWVSGAGPAQRLKDGSVLVPAGRPITLGYGMPDGKALAGASDLGGWTSVVVTPEMVGRAIAVATYIEAKRPVGGVASKDQLNFIDQVRKAGGIAGIANTPAVAQSIVKEWLARGIGSSPP